MQAAVRPIFSMSAVALRPTALLQPSAWFCWTATFAPSSSTSSLESIGVIGLLRALCKPVEKHPSTFPSSRVLREPMLKPVAGSLRKAISRSSVPTPWPMLRKRQSLRANRRTNSRPPRTDLRDQEMSILIDEKTPIVVQGITGDKGTFHTKEMIAYGSNVVGGVTPGKGGTIHLGLPVFDTMKEAVKATEATASITFVAPGFAADAIMEAADAGIRLVCSITDGIPAQDMIRVKRYLMRYPKERRTMLVGPNCAGIISPGKAMLGIMPGHIYIRGAVGVVSRSGTLGYEAASQLKAVGIGISTSVGIGGDPINGSSFLDHLALFEQDDETEAVLMIGEIGGPQEAQAAAWIKDNMSKPVVGFVAGLTAPKGRRMGHAGAIISAAGDSAAEKTEIMRSYGLQVAPSPAEFGSAITQVLTQKKTHLIPA